jgi:Flp pilus assembly protein TadB
MVTGLLAAAWAVAIALPVAHRASGVAVRERVGATRAPVVRPSLRDRVGVWQRVVVAGQGRGRVRRVLADAGSRLRRRSRARGVERGLPLALDVITMAARAGHTPRLALGAAAAWSPPDVAACLVRVEQRCALGASLTEALDELGREEPALRGLTDAVAVAERSGAPIADLLARVSDDARAALRRRAEAHARRVPVRLLFPLVFLVLPAFGLLTVVPALAAGLRHT